MGSIAEKSGTVLSDLQGVKDTKRIPTNLGPWVSWRLNQQQPTIMQWLHIGSLHMCGRMQHGLHLDPLTIVAGLSLTQLSAIRTPITIWTFLLSLCAIGYDLSCLDLVSNGRIVPKRVLFSEEKGKL